MTIDTWNAASVKTSWGSSGTTDLKLGQLSRLERGLRVPQ